MVGVIAAIGDQTADRAGSAQQGVCHGDIVGIPGREQQNAWPPVCIGQRVELARPPAARLAEGLGEGPPFPPAAERCALICVLSIAAVP